MSAAAQAHVPHRLVAVHCDLGEDDEWPGTRELAAEHAHHFGIRFEIVRREVIGPDGVRRPQGLLDYIASRPQQKWPDAARRFCTSAMKREPSLRLMTKLATEIRRRQSTPRPVHILNVFGLRAEESTRRARQQTFGHDLRASNRTVRHVDWWLPRHDWSSGEVWDRISQAGTRAQPVYTAGMPRLSCRFCVLASRSALVRAAQLDPQGAQRRADLERSMGHQFRRDLSIGEIIEQATLARMLYEHWDGIRSLPIDELEGKSFALAGLINAMDEWLCDGNLLPADWQRPQES